MASASITNSPVASDAVCFKAVSILLLVHVVAPFVYERVIGPFISILSSFAITLERERERDRCLLTLTVYLLPCVCLLSVLRPFLAVPWAGF